MWHWKLIHMRKPSPAAFTITYVDVLPCSYYFLLWTLQCQMCLGKWYWLLGEDGLEFDPAQSCMSGVFHGTSHRAFKQRYQWAPSWVGKLCVRVLLDICRVYRCVDTISVIYCLNPLCPSDKMFPSLIYFSIAQRLNKQTHCTIVASSVIFPLCQGLLIKKKKCWVLGERQCHVFFRKYW